MTRIVNRMLALATAATLAGCAAALPERIEGTNYDAASAPFLAAGIGALEPDARLPHSEALVHRVLLVGDAGVPQESEPVLEAVGLWGDAHPERTTVLFLGDNLYPAGLEEDDLPRGEAVLQAQLDASAAHEIFLPGNHDWGFPAEGVDRVLRQQAYVEARGAGFLPRDGCPGPVYHPLVPRVNDASPGLGLILIDIDPWFVPEETRPSCPGAETPKALADQLSTLLEHHHGEWLIVAAHHPLRTGGPHGGFSRGWLADTITGALFLVYGSLQDAYEEGYRAIMLPIEEALAGAPPLLFAAGHDHNLQVLDGNGHARFQLVSGAGATDRVRGGYVTSIEGTLFAHGHPGFMALDIERTPDGERALLYVIETGKARPVLTMDLGAP